MQIDDIKALVDQGKTRNEIQEILGISKSALKYHVNKNGWVTEKIKKPKKKFYKPKGGPPLSERGSLCIHCGNAWINRCEKIKNGAKVYKLAEVKNSSTINTVIVKECDHYIHDSEIDRPHFYETLNTDIKYSDIGNDRKYARGSNIKRR